MTAALPRRLLLAQACAWIGAAALPASVRAQADYPSRTIRMMVPFAPGGATDIVARVVAHHLGAALGQQVVVDNKPGANGVIGTAEVARAAPDGYTLLMNTAGAQVLNPALYKAGYEPLASFAPVALLASVGLALVVNPALGVQSVAELAAWPKKGGRPLNFAGGSSMISLLGEELKTTLGLADMAVVAYKGTGPQTQAMLSGEADLTIDPFVAVPHVRSGKLKALAVLGPKRSAALPGVPSGDEAGLERLSFASWAGLLAPAGTPSAIVRRLNAECLKILARPDVRETFAKADYETIGSTPEQFAQLIAKDAERWARVVKERGFKASN